MSNPSMPNLPGFGAIAETMELVRNMWGGMSAPGIGMPGIVMPTLSIDEINKQISDLKAVESWLTLNMNMLRGTIQALEVQSATISTLKSMGETFSASVKPAAASPATMPAASGFSFPFGAAPTTPPSQAAPAPTSWAPSAGPATPVPEGGSPESGPETSMPSEPGEASADKAAPKKPGVTDAGFGAPLVNPAAWWNMLQDQFKHAVGSVLPTDAAGKGDDTTAGAKRGTASRKGPKPSAKGGGASSARKPAAKAKTAGTTASKTAGKTASKQAAKPARR